jgi:muramoyltetrapeptide carboxypeptidase LdcA involved in peptidoglycan recycling
VSALTGFNLFNFESYAGQQFKKKRPIEANADECHDNINKTIPKGSEIQLRTSGRIQGNR